MTMQDTYKFGTIYVDAALTIEALEDQGAFDAQQEGREALREFEESSADFTFDPDWAAGYSHPYMGDPDQLPLVHIGTFGGYPGDSIDRANADAAKEWAEDRDDILVHSSRVGGCELVTLWYDLSSMTAGAESAQEAVELAEGFRDYPCLDEDKWGEYQWNAWNAMIGEMITEEENNREFDFTPIQKEQLCDLTGEMYGNWEDGYFPEDTWNEIVGKVLSGEVQLHQNDKLPIYEEV